MYQYSLEKSSAKSYLYTYLMENHVELFFFFKNFIMWKQKLAKLPVFDG